MKLFVPKLKRSAVLFCFLLALSYASIAQISIPPPSGNGTVANPYEITTLNNLYWLTQNSTEWDKHYVQTANIDADETSTWDSGAGFLPIGNSTIKFSGSYNGQGFIVDNIQVIRPNEDFIGFFGRLEDANIEYLGITNVNFQGRKYVGGFFGHSVNSTIANCYSTGAMQSTTSTDWWSQVGGFAGAISSGDISACYTTVNVSSSKGIIGGFIGINGGAISNCYAAGEVTGNTSGRIGGFSGQNSGTIRDSYSIGHVSVDDDAKGGFNGYSIGGTILSCFWDTETSGLTVSDRGTGLTTAEMKNAISFINAGWDFAAETVNGAEDIWGMNCADHDGYPYLIWQGFTHDAIYPELNAATLDDLVADCEVSSIEAPTATDDCMGEIVGVCNTSFPIVQSKIITWTFDDTNGQVVTQTQEVTILDDVAPVLDNATLTDITTECEVTELTAPTATDNCSGIIEGVPDVELPITSSTVVTWTYTDNNGNSVSQTQNIEITSDTTDPVPDEETLADIITQCDITELPIPTATDNCAGIIEAVHDAEFPITSSIVVTWTYTDNNGNSVSQIQNIEITGDIIDPVPDEGTLADLSAVCEVNELSIPTATDNCAGMIEGVHNAEFPIISSTVVTWTYTDNDGNSTTQTQNIIIEQVPTPQGDGSEINPFQIATLENLYWLTNKASVWDKHFIQTADIDASETSTWEEGAGFTPIGNNTFKFTGYYNGQGFIIDNIHIIRPEEDNIGFFGRLEDAQIENLGITNASIQGRQNVGGFVGGSVNSTVSKCYSSGEVQSTTSPDWWSQVGGFAGSISSGFISACYTTVSVSSSKGIIGGFVGANVGSISNCYATGAVTGVNYGRVGGFSGQNAGTISSSFSSGRTSSNNSTLGGFNGFDSGGTILDCFWDKESSGFTVSDGGIGLVSSQIKNVLNLIDAGWDFASETENGTDDIWGMNCSDNEGYPFLIWQGFDHDDIDPVPDAISLSAIESDCHITTLIPPAASDNCTGTITGVTDVELPITSSTVITWRYDDTNGQVITQTQEVIISDDVIAPVPDEETLADIITQCEITELTVPTATDNCSGQITGTHNATLPITGQGTIVITWTYTDDNGNSVTQMQNAIIEDTTAPVPNTSFPADITAECQVSELTAPTATDNCSGQIVGTHNAILPINTQGTTVITWSYTDSYGNTATQTQNVIIEDSTAPVPDNAPLSDINAVCEVSELTIPTATDNCDGMINGTHNIQLPITSSKVIIWTYTDDNGNSVTQMQNVVIEDIVAPVPDNATLADITAECEVTSLTAPTATDNCSGQIVGNHNIALPITSQGTTVITWTYTDNNGNSVTQTQNVVIEDITAPIPDNATLADITAECEVTELTAPTATDYCSGQIVGNHNIALPITEQGTTVVTWTYTDDNGNSVTQTQNVVIEDTEAPVPDNATLADISAECEVTELTAPTATDNCSGQIVGTHNITLPITDEGTTVITWSYTDDNGNSVTQTQNVVIEDTEAPVPDNATLADISGECEVASLTSPTATDNCSGQIAGIHNSTLPITSQGTTIVTWTYTDDNGNSVTQMQNVVIEDTEAPVPDNATLVDISAECEVSELTAPTATDNCSGQVVGTHNVTLPITSQGTTIVTWTYTDDNGNSVTQMQNVVIEDTEAPVPDNAMLVDIITKDEITELIAPTATDNCSGQIVGTHNVTLPITTQGTTVITWTYTDDNSNSTTQTQNVVIEQKSPPEGDGTEANPYEIATLDNLFWLKENSTEWDKHFIQTADIDASETSTWDGGAGFSPIGNSTIKFTGSYNGQGFTIDNIQINLQNEDNIGFFGRLEDAQIENLGITNANIQGRRYVGGFFGLSVNSTIARCYSTGTVQSTTSTDWWSQVGGFAGAISSGDISACYTTVIVSSSKGIIGGFVGSNAGSISNCYATGRVVGNVTGRVGGFSGQNSGPISNSYSTGLVSVDDTAKGGFNGYNNGGTITSCLWDEETSGLTSSNGGTGLSTSQMKNAIHFIDAGWDFAVETDNGNENTWGISCSDNDGYPFLIWQGYTHDAIAPTIGCVGNKSVDADESHIYTVVGEEYDLTEISDNCGVASITNDFNNQSTLAGAQLPEGTTTITWTVTDNAGNTNSCSFDVVVNAYTTGIDDLQKVGIKIYPNPATHNLTVKMGKNRAQRLTLTDLTGRVMLTKENPTEIETLDISNLSSGVYLLGIQYGSKVYSTRLVKE